MSADLIGAAKVLSWGASFAASLSMGLSRVFVQTVEPGAPLDWVAWGGQVIGLGALVGLIATVAVRFTSRAISATDSAQTRLADENAALREECRLLRVELRKALAQFGVDPADDGRS